MAKTIIRTKAQLKKVYMEHLKGMIEKTTDKLFDTLEHFLIEYYCVYTPSSYRRTMDFLRSAFKIEPKIEGNRVVAYVGIDVDSLDDYKISGEQVVKWANEGLHGGVYAGDSPRVWDDTIAETIENGELLRLAKQYLVDKGFKVK